MPSGIPRPTWSALRQEYLERVADGTSATHRNRALVVRHCRWLNWTTTEDVMGGQRVVLTVEGQLVLDRWQRGDKTCAS